MFRAIRTVVKRRCSAPLTGRHRCCADLVVVLLDEGGDGLTPSHNASAILNANCIAICCDIRRAFEVLQQRAERARGPRMNVFFDVRPFDEAQA